MIKSTTAMFTIVSVAVPGLVMLGARYFGQAPSQSQAYSEFAVPELLAFDFVAHAPPEDGTKASDLSEGTIESPFWCEQSASEPIFTTSLMPTDPMPMTQGLDMSFEVTTILPHPQNPLAIINSKPHRIGDEVLDGWVLQEINGDARTVTLIHHSGQKRVVSLADMP